MVRMVISVIWFRWLYLLYKHLNYVLFFIWILYLMNNSGNNTCSFSGYANACTSGGNSSAVGGAAGGTV
jgi:hypothetical protein